jgi:hypothetical protein
MFIPWILFVFMFSIAVYSFDSLVVDNPHQDYRALTCWILQGAVLVGVFFNFVNETIRFYSKKALIAERNSLAQDDNVIPYTLGRHLRDFWTLLNFGCITCTAVGISLRFANDDETNTSRGFLAVASIFNWYLIILAYSCDYNLLFLLLITFVG